MYTIITLILLVRKNDKCLINTTITLNKIITETFTKRFT
jgi:hypothetical protein